MIPKQIEHGFTMNVLLLYPHDTRCSFKWLGIAKADPENKLITVKMFNQSQSFYEGSSYVDVKYCWKAHYLGSVLSEQRMYQACGVAIKLPCLDNIIRANLSLYPSRSNVPVASLNFSQSRAIDTFLKAPSAFNYAATRPTRHRKNDDYCALIRTT